MHKAEHVALCGQRSTSIAVEFAVPWAKCWTSRGMACDFDKCAAPNSCRLEIQHDETAKAKSRKQKASIALQRP